MSEQDQLFARSFFITLPIRLSSSTLSDIREVELETLSQKEAFAGVVK